MMLVVAFSFVRQIRAEVKKLKSGKYSGKHPENDQIFSRQKQLEQIEGKGHEQDLPNGHILPDEAQVPWEKPL